MDKLGGPKHERYSDLLLNLGSLQAGVGRPEQAIATYKKAMVSIERRLGKQHVDLVFALSGLAANLLQLGRPAEAVPYARRGIPLAKRLRPANLYLMRIYLGRALFGSGQDKRGGHKLVVDAANAMVKLGGGAVADGRKHLAWAHRNPVK